MRKLNSSLTHAIINDRIKAYTSLAEAKRENIFVKFGFPGIVENFRIASYNDASLETSGWSQGGFIILVSNKDR